MGNFVVHDKQDDEWQEQQKQQEAEQLLVTAALRLLYCILMSCGSRFASTTVDAPLAAHVVDLLVSTIPTVRERAVRVVGAAFCHVPLRRLLLACRNESGELRLLGALAQVRVTREVFWCYL